MIGYILTIAVVDPREGAEFDPEAVFDTIYDARYSRHAGLVVELVAPCRAMSDDETEQFARENRKP